MNLKTIRENLQGFSRYLESSAGRQNSFLYESPLHFQKHWDLDSPDLKTMYLGSFQNSQTRRLWKRESFRPLEAMRLFWDLDPDYVRNMFLDLFREQNAVDGRIGRFVFHCDQMLAIYRKANPASVWNTHYHGHDYWMISLYLAFRYPENYSLYPDAAFRKCLAAFGAQPMPTAMPDLERFFKVSRTLFALMKKEEGLLEKHTSRLDEKVHYMEPCLLLVYEFICLTAKEALIP